MAATQKRTFLIAIRATGDKALKQTVRSLKRLERTTKSIRNSMKGLRTIFLATFAGAGILRITEAADSIQLLSDRINIFTGDTVEGAAALDQLFNAANLTNTSVDSLAETFNRVALATQELGLSTSELIGFTATLQNTFRLSGASTAESSAAAIQLSQGLASGQLRGQELRSVLEQNAVIGGILAKTLGTTRGQLIKFAETGKITSEVVLKALAENAEDLNKKAQGLGQTFGQTITKAFNDAKRKINEFNKEFKLNEKFADLIDISGQVLTFIGEFFKEIRDGQTLTAKFARFIDQIVEGYRLMANEVGLGFRSDIIKKEIRGIDEEILSLLETQDEIKSGGGLFGLFKLSDSEIKSKTKSVDKAIDVLIGKSNKLTDELKKIGDRGRKPGKNPALKTIEDFGKGNYTQKLKETAITLEQLNSKFSGGVIDADTYATILERIGREDLGKKFTDGKIALQEYRQELLKLGDDSLSSFEKIGMGIEFGARNYAKGVKTVTTEMTGLVETTFGRLEDAIFDFTKGTADAFAKMTQAILDDLLKIAIRQQIVGPIANGIFSAASTSGASGAAFDAGVGGSVSGTTGVLAAAKGSVLPFAQGGVVTRPTSFPLSTGTGLMAEAGSPEAVVPLKRTSNGDLGVQAVPSNVTVNVNNQSGAEVDVQSQQNGNNQILDITITKAVNNAINAGRLDRSLSSNYGLNRKGNR